MHINGQEQLYGSREAVWAMLFNPQALRHLVPGCRELHRLSPNEFYGLVQLGLPAVAGLYEVKVKITQQNPPQDCALEGLITGTTGTASGTAMLALEELDRACRLHYEAGALITGPLSYISPRVLERAAQEMIKQGIKRFNRELNIPEKQG
ncbi:MAG: SRPBCC domain-containing protein [Anaerolineales bacterium]|nr:SRPBCC domain-containing protein [Anaerolineales bacterium]